jgi:cytoskeletal protein CcmA (bactofilin family)
MKKLLLFSSLALILFMIPVAIYASHDRFYIAEDEEYNANLYWAGEELNIMGTVNGDVYAAGNQITISGDVKGDVIGAAESIKITGSVDGNVRIAAKSIVIDGEVKRALSAVGETIYINDKASVGATVLAAAKSIELRGDVAGNLDVAAESVFISGKVTHTNIHEVDSLVLSDTAEVRGNLNYKAVIEAEIGESAIIGGDVNYKKAVVRDFSRYKTTSFFASRFMGLLSLYLLGLILLSMFKKPTVLVIKKMKNDPMRTILWGLVAFIVIPILAVIFAITVIGLPITFILVATYVVMIYIAQVYAGLLMGRYIASKFKWKMTWPWALLLGLVIFVILKSLPFIGGLFFFIIVWWGIGGIMQVKKDYLSNKTV